MEPKTQKSLRVLGGGIEVYRRYTGPRELCRRPQSRSGRRALKDPLPNRVMLSSVDWQASLGL